MQKNIVETYVTFDGPSKHNASREAMGWLEDVLRRRFMRDALRRRATRRAN